MYRPKMWSSRKPRLLNNIRLTGSVWIASDIHLGPQVPATAQAFHDFLDQAFAQADALILCGDIFDAWIGDDFALTTPPDWLSPILARLRQLAQKMPVWLGRGNRDFLIGAALADHIGARLLPDQVCLDTDWGKVLLSHGDEYCTADRGYQRFRRIVRCRAVQRIFLALPLRIRLDIANWARKRSTDSNRYKAPSIMDVNAQAIRQAFISSGVTTLVHGHTHRPAVHHSTINGVQCTRIVLPDWDFDHGNVPRGGWLIISEQGPALHQAPKSA